MTHKACDTYNTYPSDLMTESLTNDDPSQKLWRLMCEKYSAARRALYTAWAQLG
jgi:hypothetical protein